MELIATHAKMAITYRPPLMRKTLVSQVKFWVNSTFGMLYFWDGKGQISNLIKALKGENVYL